ncbi:hypothetical protein ACWENR_07295 [Micromonospora sp. NPDC004336]
MKIDSSVEAAMRVTIHAAVKRDFGMLDQQLQALRSDELARSTVQLTLAVVGYLMTDVHGGRPTPEQVTAIATEIAKAESWARPTRDEIEVFLSKLMSGEPFGEAVPIENIIVLTFVVAANLLSSCRRDDEKWWDYLDRAEAAIEAAG